MWGLMGSTIYRHVFVMSDQHTYLHSLISLRWTLMHVELRRAPVAEWIGELTPNPLGFSPLWFEPRSHPCQ